MRISRTSGKGKYKYFLLTPLPMPFGVCAHVGALPPPRILLLSRGASCSAVPGEYRPMPPTRYDALPMQQIGRAEQDDLLDPTRSPLFALVGASEAVLSAVSWAACSIGMTLLNKVSVNKSGSPYGVVLVQMGVTCVAAVATRDLRFGEGTRRWAVSVPALFVVMMVTSMLALQV